MSGTVETVHVAFGPSRAESIRIALRKRGCEARVVGLPSALNFGPIDPPDPDVRQAWIRSVLRCEPADDQREDEAPWTEVTSARVHPIYWVCRSDAGEHACFLEFAFRMAGRPFDIVEATGLDFVTRDGVPTPWSLGLLRPEDIIASGLGERRRPFSQTESEAAFAAWLQLRRENAPLRIVRDGRLVSAPVTTFDACLIEQSAPEWEVVAKLIGRAMEHLSFGMDPPGQSPGDTVLFGRVRALADAGLLDIAGVGPGMRDYEVRAPAARRPS